MPSPRSAQASVAIAIASGPGVVLHRRGHRRGGVGKERAEGGGASRIAWGSNVPASEGTLRQILTESRRALAFLPEPDQEWIFWRTAQTLYPALADR